MKVFYSLPPLIACADQALANKDVVSIDIFDTLFIRRIHDPDMVKFPVARFIASHANKLGIAISWRKVWDLRDQIEAEHRVRNGRDFSDNEAHYDDYMLEVLQQIFAEQLSADLFDRVADYEIRMESAVIVPRQMLVDWLKQLTKNPISLCCLMMTVLLPSMLNPVVW